MTGAIRSGAREKIAGRMSTWPAFGSTMDNPFRLSVRRSQATRSGVALLTIWGGCFKESVCLWEVDKVELLEIIIRARVCQAGHIMINGGLEGTIYGVSQNAGCA